MSRIYRAREKDSSQWVYGYPVEATGGYLVSENAKEVVFIDSEKKIAQIRVFSVDPTTLGQFIGRYDERGSRIFEGDIVIKNKRYWGVKYNPEYMEFMLYRNDGKADGCMISKEKLVVVGNVWDDSGRLTGMTREEAIAGLYVPTQLRYATKNK